MISICLANISSWRLNLASVAEERVECDEWLESASERSFSCGGDAAVVSAISFSGDGTKFGGRPRRFLLKKALIVLDFGLGTNR